MHTQKSLNDLAYKIIACAIEVHNHLGPGLLESVYELCLVEEMRSRGMKVEVQKVVPIFYKGRDLHATHRIDLIVEDCIIVELKAAEALHPVHSAQLFTYMRLCQIAKGLLINFNAVKIVDDLKPLVNDLFAALPKE